MKFKLLCSGMLSIFASSSGFGAPLTIEMRDGTAIEIGSDNLEISFASNNLKASWNDGSREIPVSEISSFYFISSPSTVVPSELDENIRVEVYSIDGRVIGQFNSEAEVSGTLPKGLYVLKSGSKISKTVIR